MSAYLVQRGVFRKHDGTEKHSFDCHRSGHFISKSKGIRCMKAQGSKKINAYCPSNMQVEVSPDGSRSVQYLRKHVGHTNDLCHLFLTNEERKHLALKMASKIPLQTILDEVRDDTCATGLQRIDLVTNQDLLNIEKSFNLGTSHVYHEDDAVSVQAWVIQTITQTY
nr:uncharacterized protein LOC122269213 [Parasteatoda tepidariorum]